VQEIKQAAIMAGLVTKETNRSVDNFMNGIDNAAKRDESMILLDLMESATDEKPKVWGNEKVPDFLIGFGKYSYKRKGSNEEFEWFKTGFAPRNTKITLYLTSNLKEHEHLVMRLGKCKTGSGCLYINKLADVDLDILRELIERTHSKK
jgi:hypothetical protein